MKITKIITTIIKTLKQLKKPTIWTLIIQFSSLLFNAIKKNYKFMSPLLKILRVFRLWSIGSIFITILFSFTSSMFELTYDYTFIAILVYGLCLVAKELLYEYYFDINNWFKSVIDKTAESLNNKINNDKQNILINKNNIDKFNHKIKWGDPFSLETINRENIIDEMHNKPYNKLRSEYKDYTIPDDNYIIWKDPAFYIFIIGTVVALYAVGVHYDIVPEPKLPNMSNSWDYIKTSTTNIYNTVKDWLFRVDGDGSTPDIKGKGKAPANLIDMDEDIKINSGNTTPRPSSSNLRSYGGSSSSNSKI